jgi:hypothetical protein
LSKSGEFEQISPLFVFLVGNGNTHFLPQPLYIRKINIVYIYIIFLFYNFFKEEVLPVTYLNLSLLPQGIER